MIAIPKRFQFPEYLQNMSSICRLFVDSAKVRPRIPRTEYAKTITVPNGPKAGEKYRPETQPVCDLILKELDKDYWPTFLFLWSVQSGKSLTFVDIETCYIIEVLQEDQILALPDKDMYSSKWKEIRKILEMKGSDGILPKSGPGSKEGSAPAEVAFTNGAKLMFMTSGTSDSGRSGKTARHVCVDEIDKQTSAQSTSKETSPHKQYEARMRSFEMKSRRFRGTSTVGDPDGYLWTSYKKYSFGHVLSPCPHCEKYIFPERKDVLGWQQARTELEAMELACICCPECSGRWTESQRVESVRSAVIAYRGQTVDKNGVVCGDLPDTLIGVVRASGLHDILGKSLPDLGRMEFLARQKGNTDEDEKDILQFYYTAAPESKKEEAVPLTIEHIIQKPMAETRRYIVPENTDRLIVGVDMHSHWMQGVVLARLESPKDVEGNFVVVDYFNLDSGWMVYDKKKRKERISGLETEGKASWFRMLDRLFVRCFEEGWQFGNDRICPGRVYIDSRYNRPNSKAINDKYVIDEWMRSLDFCRFEQVTVAETGAKYWRCRYCNQRVEGDEVPENRICAIRMNPDRFGAKHRDLFRMTMGLGKSERDRRQYRNPGTGKHVVSCGSVWHEIKDIKKDRHYFMFDADWSKLQVQNRFFRPAETPGTMQLYRVDNIQDHQPFALSVTAKMQVTEKDKTGKDKTDWKVIRENDHILDATGIAFVGDLIEEEKAAPEADIEVIEQEVEHALRS